MCLSCRLVSSPPQVSVCSSCYSTSAPYLPLTHTPLIYNPTLKASITLCSTPSTALFFSL